MKPVVGWIGVGLMGKPMAANLVKKGYKLVVWNRTRSRAEELARAGATVAASPEEAAAAADILFTIVSDPPALETVLWGPKGALGGLGRGSVLVDSSTVSPALERRVAQACAERGVEFLDAPVTGGTWGAEKGEVVFMIGGEKKTLDRVEPVLLAMGKRFFHLGPHGAGQTVKLAMNMLYALEVQAFAEALALVAGAGIPGERLVEVMESSMGRAPLLDVKAPLLLKQEFPPSFPLRLMHKDLSLALELGNQLGVALPATAAARETYNFVEGAAQTDLDYAAVGLFWRERLARAKQAKQ
jgi:3-hydroxyisobutyrate dehydrogenase-like beta-hydroxyacid dehydrogenase